MLALPFWYRAKFGPFLLLGRSYLRYDSILPIEKLDYLRNGP